jgi:asparagine synthase (glutamine-hydrolysing)
MCGIAAVVDPAGRLDSGEVSVAVDTMQHRGPDGSGTWASRCRRVALGQTRLAVIDLITGDQPMHTADGAYHFVGNAEFYGYGAIRAELNRRGHRLLTTSDNEIALHLYAESGHQALERLRGEFAFVIWDEVRGELFAARDRFGVRPLFFAQHAGRVCLASEIKALVAMGVPAAWDPAALADHLISGLPADRTLFAGVRQVPPGQFLRTDGRRLELRPYWDLDYPTAAELPTAAESASHRESVQRAVLDAIRTRQWADVPVAYHLSGGLDSSAVVCAAARSGPVATFTVRFDDPAYDEGETARRTASFVGATHTEIPIRRSELLDGLEEMVASGEFMQENSHGIARKLQSAAIRDHGYKVALAGEGGDELFAGYPQTRRDLAFSVSDQVRAQTRASYAKLLAHGAPRHLQTLVAELDFVPGWILDRHLTVTAPIGELLSDSFAGVLAERDPFAELFGSDRGADQLAGRTPYHQSMYLVCKTWLCNYLLAAERLDMAHGVEVRLPFLDHHLADVAKWTPLEWHLAGDRSKPVLREAMRDYLPDEVHAGEKRPFFAPSAVTDDAALARFRRIVERDTLDSLPFFDPPKVRALTRRMSELPPARRTAYERPLQIVAGAVLLTERYGMASTPAEAMS